MSEAKKVEVAELLRTLLDVVKDVQGRVTALEGRVGALEKNLEMVGRVTMANSKQVLAVGEHVGLPKVKGQDAIDSSRN